MAWRRISLHWLLWSQLQKCPCSSCLGNVLTLLCKKAKACRSNFAHAFLNVQKVLTSNSEHVLSVVYLRSVQSVPYIHFPTSERDFIHHSAVAVDVPVLVVYVALMMLLF
uniref:Secreted protein n=1 Tax=Ixodes ricinus TaxID=34613 RepID=A0A6B0UJ56_IXORI